ncbi:sugar transferase [Rubellimicrobium sp. CFH 75288]|uniref:sugar transferase n=1 Tax=Rubellimicrobium sp. CFH 75288 TaxID=2697034 RepID=UPI00352B91E1
MTKIDTALARPFTPAGMDSSRRGRPAVRTARPAPPVVARPGRMPWGKRAFDLSVSLVLLLLLWPVMLLVALVLLVAEGRPILYMSERMAAPGRPFRLIKFRTMAVGADAVGGVTGGDKAAAMSRLHRFLRRTRADELPQLWNVLRGEMSLVGPRPPLRRYVEAYPELYGRVLQARPGITGLATLVFHEEEERLLAACRTPDETEAVYRRLCIPRKARLDLLYQRRWSLWLDLCLVARTALRPFRRSPDPAPPPPQAPGATTPSATPQPSVP